MRTRYIGLGIAMVVCAGAAWGQISVSGVAGGSLSALVDTSTLVTVTIKSGATDPNLTVEQIGPDYVVFRTQEGRARTYRTADISNVHVQDGKIAEKRFKITERGALTVEQQQLLTQAVDRAQQLFQLATDIQQVRMIAAVISAAGGEGEVRTKSIEYLSTLVNSNDTDIALMAADCLYLVGEDEKIPPKIISLGLGSGRRDTRAEAALMAGLTGYRDEGSLLSRMARDRSAELSGPAVVALARLGNREIIPTLIDTLDTLSEEKARAAVFALSTLGGQDLIDQLELKARDSSGFLRFRIAQVLYNLGSPEGRRLLKDEVLKEPSLQVDAAMILASRGEIDALQIIRERLDRRYDENFESLQRRANMAASAIKGDDRSKITILQELLRGDDIEVKDYVLKLIPDIGLRSLVTILPASVQDQNPLISVRASIACVALLKPDFRKRMLKSAALQLPWSAAASNSGDPAIED